MDSRTPTLWSVFEQNAFQFSSPTPTLWSVVEHDNFYISNNILDNLDTDEQNRSPLFYYSPVTIPQSHSLHFGHAFRPAHAASITNRATARTPTLWSVVEQNAFQFSSLTPRVWSVVEHDNFSISNNILDNLDTDEQNRSPLFYYSPVTIHQSHFLHFGHAFRPGPCGQQNKPGNRPHSDTLECR